MKKRVYNCLSYKNPKGFLNFSNASYPLTITGLISNTTYHVRSFATNSVGTSYGGDVSFTTSKDTQIGNGIKTLISGNKTVVIK
jgi:hypothetical protein